MQKVSIIVPIYNAEQYLEKCLLSILNQTLKDIEIILINDGSEDNSQEIIDKYQKRYPNIIKSKTIENSGVSNARNVGLEMAVGEYIGFVDGDDYIEETMYEKLYKKAQLEQADIVTSGYFIKKDRQIVAYQCRNEEQYNKSVIENPHIYIYGVPYVWNKIFKRDLITENHIKFGTLRIFEDLEFVYKLYMKANKISKVCEPLYYYVKQNEQSLTYSFSDKFLDIMDAIKSLKEYSKECGYYEILEEYLIYVALNHIYIRCDMKVPASQVKMKLKYIDETFKFLDTEFPNWKEHEIYFEKNKKDKKQYISKNFWKKCTKDIKRKKISRKIKKVTRFNKFGSIYLKYYKKLKIEDKMILIDSQHGKDINGNMFYLIKELSDNPKYQDYKIYVGVKEEKIEEFNEKLSFYNIKNYELVISGSQQYAQILATAKYLLSDTSFCPQFIKKEGQVYLNTWHGTPLKASGRNTKNNYANIPNLQKNFVAADYLLYPSEYMMNHMLEDYMIDNIAHNKILLCGYPRNSVFLDEQRRKMLKKNLELEDKEVIAYMPILKKTQSQKKTKEYIETLQELLEYLSDNLNEKQILYVNIPLYIRKYIKFDNYTNIKLFPKQYETYDFLNICDTLITNYSNLIFDFALTRKKIILFTKRNGNKSSEKGLYVDLDKLPFARVYKMQDLLAEINTPQETQYDEFIKKFCAYDEKDIPAKLCEKVILNNQVNLKTIEMPNNNKDNVLILVRNFANKDINKKIFDLLKNINSYSYNYYIGYISKSLTKYSYNLLKIPKEICYMGQLYSMCNLSLKERIMFKLYHQTKGKLKLQSKKYDELLKLELKRIYHGIDFKTVVLFGERHEVRIRLFSNYNKAKTVLYTTNGIRQEYKDRYDYVISPKELEGIKNLNEIIEIGEKK